MDGNRATVSELLDAATKLDRVADEMEHTGKKIGAAGAAAVAAHGGFRMAVQSVTTLGQLDRCVADTVRDMRAQAEHLRQTAASYTELDRQAQTQVTVK